MLRHVTAVSYETENMGRRRGSSFVAHLTKVKLFHDRNELCVDSDEEEDKGWIPASRKRVIPTCRNFPSTSNEETTQHISF